MDDATIISKLDHDWRTVITIRGRLKVYDGCQEKLTTALRRLAREGRIEADRQPTKCPIDRRQSDGPPFLTIERYRLPCRLTTGPRADKGSGDVESFLTINARVGQTDGATTHDQSR